MKRLAHACIAAAVVIGAVSLGSMLIFATVGGWIEGIVFGLRGLVLAVGCLVAAGLFSTGAEVYGRLLSHWRRRGHATVAAADRVRQSALTECRS